MSAAFGATSVCGLQKSELTVVGVVNGGKAVHAMPVAFVNPKAAGFARISAKSENTSTGMTRSPAPARPEKRVVL